MRQFLLEIDNFVASKAWIFIPVAVVCVTVMLITVLDMIRQGMCAFVLPYIASTDVKRYGEWAVVTGATDGIGKAYCRYLGEKGMNIVIVSRDQDRLEKTAKELIDDYSIKVCTIQADFRNGWRLQEELSALLKDKEIGILVNNVGKAMNISRSFHHQKSNVIIDLITVNIESCLIMTKIILPQMLRRRKGIVVAVSSLSSLESTSMLACYGASKAAMTAISRALFYEYRKSGVEFQCLVPSCVATKIGLIKNNTGLLKLIFPSPETYCKNAVRTLGLSDFTTGYLPHGFLWLFIDKWTNEILVYIYKRFLMENQLRRG